MLGQLIFSPVLRDRLRFDVPSTRRHVFSVEGASGTRPRPFRLKLVSCLMAGSLPHLQKLCVLLEYQFGPRARQTFPNGTFPRLKTAVSRLNGRLSGQGSLFAFFGLPVIIRRGIRGRSHEQCFVIAIRVHATVPEEEDAPLDAGGRCDVSQPVSCGNGSIVRAIPG